MARSIVCAACRNPHDGNIFLGARHFDQVMVDIIQLAYGKEVKCHDWDQGFIDQWGNFLGRFDSYTIAKENNQLKEESDKDFQPLFSEDLY